MIQQSLINKKAKETYHPVTAKPPNCKDSKEASVSRRISKQTYYSDYGKSLF